MLKKARSWVGIKCGRSSDRNGCDPRHDGAFEATADLAVQLEPELREEARAEAYNQRLRASSRCVSLIQLLSLA